MYYSSESLFEGSMWKILQAMLILRLYANVTEKANRLNKMTLPSISADHHCTSLMNMFLSTVFGGKLN